MSPLGRVYKLDVKGIAIHCEEAGEGYPIILIHGSAPGASSRNTWPVVFSDLAKEYRLIATDLIGWGYSGRKKQLPFFDPDIWALQVQAIIDHIAPAGGVGILGHSLGGYVSLLSAARDHRVGHVLANGALGYPYPSNKMIEDSWNFPENIDQARNLYKQLLSVGSEELKEGIIQNRIDLMSDPEYRIYFSRMFDGPKQQYLDKATLKEDDLANIVANILLVYGKDDIAVPYDVVGLPLAEEIPQADLYRIANCGHASMLDAPERLIAIARAFFPRS